MEKEINYCKYCGNEYKVCSKCEANGIFKWRLNFCSVKCFKDFIGGNRQMITIQYNSKTYNVKEQDFNKNTYETVNGLKIKEEDLQGVILPIKDFLELKYGNFKKEEKAVKRTTRKKTVEEELKEETK